ncbi:MAG: Flp pilus assembly complex ATPase component TadA [Magnetococcus sp. DMHC-1]
MTTHPSAVRFRIRYSNGRTSTLGRDLQTEYVLGREFASQDSTCDISLKDVRVSRRHCRVYLDARTGNWMLEDLGSTNGTRLDGEVLLQAEYIDANSLIQVGTSRIFFSAPQSVTPASLASLPTDKSIPLASPETELEDVSEFEGMTQIGPSGQKYHASGLQDAPTSEQSTVLDMEGLKRPADDDNEEEEEEEGGTDTIINPTSLRRTSDSTLLPRHEEDEPTLMSGTIIASHHVQTTSSTPPSDTDATIVATRSMQGGTTPPSASEMEATVISTHNMQAASAASPEEESEPMVIAISSRKSTVLSTPFEADGSVEAGERENAASPDEAPEESHGEELNSQSELSENLIDMALTPCCRDENGTEVGSSLQTPVAARIATELMDANLISVLQLRGLMQKAQGRGFTFFQELSRDRSVKFVDDVMARVAKLLGCTLIAGEEALETQVVGTSWLPFDKASELGCIGLRSDNGSARYGTIDPFDLVQRDWVSRCMGMTAETVLVHPNCFFPVIRRIKDRANQDAAQETGLIINLQVDDEHFIRNRTSEVDVPQLVNYFLHRAHLQKASDIHIEATESLLMVRNRIDGVMQQEISLPMSFHSEIVSRLKILSGMDIAEKRRPQDGRFSVIIRSSPIDIRVSSFPTVFGEKFVLRLLDKNALRPSVESLGMMERDLVLLKEKIAAPYGLVMISGPTGSGKTTTLYSCLGGLDREKLNILTVEDPVEYRLAGIHQMQANARIGVTFASGLRTILRQDPDVIMVGEIRDQETASMAVQASLTGHIVFSTIHTNNAVGVVTRLLDMGIEPFLVASALSLAVAQRLVRRVCTRCQVQLTGVQLMKQLEREGHTLGRLKELGIHIDPNMDYVQGIGCPACRETGYAGRQAVFEIFNMTEEAQKIVLAGRVDGGALRDLAIRSGMTTLIRHGMRLVDEGTTTVSEVIRVLGEDQ